MVGEKPHVEMKRGKLEVLLEAAVSERILVDLLLKTFLSHNLLRLHIHSPTIRPWAAAVHAHVRAEPHVTASHASFTWL